MTLCVQMRPMRRSRALAAVGYDAAAQTLRIQFRNGRCYDYFDVPVTVYDGLLTSLHPWTQWGDHIRESYDFHRL